MGARRAIAAVLVLLLASTTAIPVAVAERADVEHCAPIKGGDPSLAALDPGARLNFIQQRVNTDARKVRIWAWTWASIYSGLVIANGTRLALAHSTRAEKIDNGVATGASAFGLLVLSIMPPAVLRDQARVAKIVSRSATEKNRCESLAAAEAILIRDAASEAFNAGPLPHAGNFVFNMALGIFLGVGLRRLDTGVIVAMTGITVGEIQMLSVKTHLRDSLQRYRSGVLTGESPSSTRPPIGWSVVPILNREQYGAQIGLTF